MSTLSIAIPFIFNPQQLSKSRRTNLKPVQILHYRLFSSREKLTPTNRQ